MPLIAALLCGFSTACAAWILIQRYQSQRTMAGRLSGVSGQLSFPYNIYGSATQVSKKLHEITLDHIGLDKITRDLFLAGLRSQKNVRFFRYLLKLSGIVPLVLIAIYASLGLLTTANFLKALVIGLVMFVYVHLLVKMLKQKRQKKILRNLPQFLDLLVVSVEAGLSFSAALEKILSETDSKEPLTQELSVMYHEYLSGLPLAQACERLNKRCEVTDLAVITSAVVRSDQMGAGLGSTLRTQAVELRDKIRQRIRTKSFQIPVRILFPVMLIFISFVLLNLSYIGFRMVEVVGNVEVQKAL